MTDRELFEKALEALLEVNYDQAYAKEVAALRERLAQPLRTHWEGCDEVHPECRKPEQEPVAWMIWTQGPVSTFLKKYEAESEFDRLNRQYPEPSRKLIALYTTPPRREWVGLTRAERFEIEKAMSQYYDYRHECKTVCLPEFAAAIEAKLKEKNNV